MASGAVLWEGSTHPAFSRKLCYTFPITFHICPFQLKANRNGVRLFFCFIPTGLNHKYVPFCVHPSMVTHSTQEALSLLFVEGATGERATAVSLGRLLQALPRAYESTAN